MPPEHLVVQPLLSSRNDFRRYRCALIKNLLTLCIAATVMNAPTAGAYEEPFHFAITMWLAELRGFNAADAFEIAKYDQAVDDDPKTQPLPDWDSAGTRRRSDYHFVNKARLDQLRSDALKCTSRPINPREVKQIGLFLHAQEDVYSHKPYGPRLGHALAGHTPDKPWNNPAGFVAMVKAKFKELEAILKECASASHSTRVALAKFKQASDALDLWSSTEYDFGTGDPDVGSRWPPLLQTLFGPRHNMYMVKYARDYEDWRKEQNRSRWRNP